MKRLAKSAALVVAVPGVLAAASYLTTSVIWDGGFPSGEFRVASGTAGRGSGRAFRRPPS
jgi:hypothetical protein